jgi:hypothetical protein
MVGDLQDWQQSYNNPLNVIIPSVLPFNQYNWPNPTVLFIGNKDWQNYLTNIPAPVPPPIQLFAGRTDEQIDGRNWRKGLERLDLHTAAVHLGRQGGLIGGPARADAHTAKQLSNFASRAARARWK